jgi:putative MATE family efflux protein
MQTSFLSWPWLFATLAFMSMAFLVYYFRHQLRQKSGLTTGRVLPAILKFTIPLLIGNIFQQVYSLVDMIIVGQYVGKQGLAAVGVAAQIMFLLISMVIGLTIGMTVVIAQLYGSKQHGAVGRAIGTSYIITGILCVVLGVIGYIFAPVLLRWMNTPADIFDWSLGYFRIMMIGILGLFGYNMAAGILRSVGDSVTPLLFLIFATALNIIFDLLFIRVWHMGVNGAAWATIVAQSVAFLGTIVYTQRLKEEYLHMHVKNLVFDLGLAKKMLGIGLPASIQQVLISVSLFIVFSLVNKYGTDAASAFTAIGRIDALVILPGMSLMMTMSTFVAQNLGSDHIQRVRKGVNQTLLFGFGLTAVLMALIVLFIQPIMQLFIKSNETQVLAIARRYFYLIGWSYPIATIMFIMNGAMRGAGKTLMSMIFSMISIILLRIILAYQLQHIWGLSGVFWSFPTTWLAGFIMTYVYWNFFGHWQKSVVAPSKVGG